MKRGVLKFVFALTVGSFFAFTAVSFAAPVNPDMSRKAGEMHLAIQKEFSVKNPLLTKGVCSSQEQYSILEIRSLENSAGTTLAYVMELSPRGYVVISPDTNLKPVIAYSFETNFSFEDVPQNIALHWISQVMEARLKVLPEISPESKEQNRLLWERYTQADTLLIQESSTATQYGPYLTTQWNQNNPYNKFCPLDPVILTRTWAGCGSISTAQILNYWKYPGFIVLTDDEKYTTYTRGIKIDDDHATLNFPSFAELNSMLSNMSYTGTENEIAALIFACGVLLATDYTASNVGSAGPGMHTAFYKMMGYGQVKFRVPPPFHEDFWDLVHANLKNARPVDFILSVDSGSGSGVSHFTVFDGLRETDTDSSEYHVNMGWGGYGDGWYTLGAGVNMPPNCLGIGGATVDIYPAASTPDDEEDGGSSVGCFIATAAFGSPMAKQIQILRDFRDTYLLTNPAGKKFVAWYYRKGPIAAGYIQGRPALKFLVRIALYPVIIISFVMLKGFLLYPLMFLCGSILLYGLRRKLFRSTEKCQQ